jgi:predicted aspartyl protease
MKRFGAAAGAAAFVGLLVWITMNWAAPSSAAQSNRLLQPVPRAMDGVPGTVQMDLARGIPIVSARLGEHQLRLIVDTGATMCMLLPEAAERLGLEVRESRAEALDAAGEARGVQSAHVQELALPTDGKDPVRFGKFDVVVMESAVARQAEVDGILGIPVFRRTVARFDFDGGTLEFGADPVPDDASDATVMRLAGGAPVAVNVGFSDARGQPTRSAGRALMIDTGFSGYVYLPRRAAEALGASTPTTQGTSATAHDQRQFERITLQANIHLGRYRIERPPASVLLGEDRGRIGAIGTAVLKEFVMTLDLPQRRIRLENDETVLRLWQP